MAGRKPKPTAIKKAQGTLQPCRESKNEMKIETIAKIPNAPSWLSAVGKKIYRTTAKQLAANNLLQSIGFPLLVSYANQMALHIEIEKMLKEEERVLAIKGENNKIKTVMINPYHKISQDALAAAQKIAVEFGLTPSAQSRIIAPFVNKNNNDDDFD